MLIFCSQYSVQIHDNRNEVYEVNMDEVNRKKMKEIFRFREIFEDI